MELVSQPSGVLSWSEVEERYPVTPCREGEWEGFLVDGCNEWRSDSCNERRTAGAFSLSWDGGCMNLTESDACRGGRN